MRRPAATDRSPPRMGRVKAALVGLWILGALAFGGLMQPDTAVADGVASIGPPQSRAAPTIIGDEAPIIPLVACALVGLGAAALLESGRLTGARQRVAHRYGRGR